MVHNGRMNSRPSPSQIRAINDTVRYAMWSVFASAEPLPEEERDRLCEEAEAFFAGLEDQGVVVRGCYDISGLRAEADLMIWWHAETIEQLQAAYQAFRRSGVGRYLEPVWSSAALHRPAEFNKGHIPAFLAGEEARAYVCVYPFVRSYDWYLLDDSRRRELLSEHGQMARGFPDVRANTIASFALNDYEWVLAFEADELHRIVDLMRHLRGSGARMHVREEVPFFTGPRRTPAQIVASLP
ncbi:chlorite dismutase [Austwickia chelonae]|nr:chlorite dismutase [Austwickia chelonae]